MCLLAINVLLFLNKEDKENKTNEINVNQQTETEFTDFIIKKKELSYTNEEVPLLNKEYYYWNEKISDYNKEINDIKPTTLENHIKSTGAEEMNLNFNSVPEIYKLDEGVLTISENEKLIWQSPDDWWIDSFVLADADNDGEMNINLSLWKMGSFGSSKPFWLEENDMSIKNHFFVLRHADNRVLQVWSSSNLTNPNCEFIIKDLNNDGQNDLVVIEGEYLEDLQCIGKYIAVWSWNGWGFSNYWRSEKANYTNLEVEKIGNKSYIIVETY